MIALTLVGCLYLDEDWVYAPEILDCHQLGGFDEPGTAAFADGLSTGKDKPSAAGFTWCRGNDDCTVVRYGHVYAFEALAGGVVEVAPTAESSGLVVAAATLPRNPELGAWCDVQDQAPSGSLAGERLLEVPVLDGQVLRLFVGVAGDAFDTYALPPPTSGSFDDHELTIDPKWGTELVLEITGLPAGEGWAGLYHPELSNEEACFTPDTCHPIVDGRLSLSWEATESSLSLGSSTRLGIDQIEEASLLVAFEDFTHGWTADPSRFQGVVDHLH